MYRLQDLVAVILPLAEPRHGVDQCHLCGAPIPKNGCPLCAVCELDQREKWDDYRTEQEQKRRPL